MPPWHFYASWRINRKADGGRLELPGKVVQERLGHSSITDDDGHPRALNLFPRGDDAAELAAAEHLLLGPKLDKTPT